MILPAAKTKSGPDGGGGIGGGRGTHLDRSAPLTRLGILKLRLLSYLYRSKHSRVIQHQYSSDKKIY